MKNQIFSTFLLLLAGVATNSLFIASSLAQEASSAAYTVHLDQPRQTIDNFGASDAWYCEAVGATWPEAQREAIARLMFSMEEGIGLSAWRVNLGAGTAEQGTASQINDPQHRVAGFLKADGTYDWSAAPGQRWFLAAARRLGVKDLVGFCNSPPVQFTLNHLGRKTVKSREANLDATRAGDFEQFLGEVAAHFALDYVSPFNEPQWDWADAKQEGSPYTNDQITSLTRGLDGELTRRGLATRILIPECAQLNYAYGQRQHAAGDEVAAFFDPASKDYLGNLKHLAPIFAGHSYFVDTNTSTILRNRQMLGGALHRLPQPPAYWMSEYSLLGNGYKTGASATPPSDMDCALFLARIIHSDLVASQAAAWQFWTALMPQADPTRDVRYCLIALHPGTQTFSATKLLWALGHWSRFVRPGWRRVNVDAAIAENSPEALGEVLVSAFAAPDAQQIAVVAVNSASTTQTLHLKIAGGQSGALSWTPWVTASGAENNLRRMPPLATEQYALAPRSIVTLLGSRK